MTAISWANGVTGNWNDKTKWNGGSVPTGGDSVTIANAGIFTVAVSAADVAAGLIFDAPNATLSESTTGSLDTGGAFALEAGTVLLRDANIFGSVTLTGGRLATYLDGALGSAALTLDGGEFTGMASENVTNRIAMGGAGTDIIDAATGTTLSLGAASPWGLDATSKPVIQFGSSVRRGVVDWHTQSGSDITAAGDYSVDVAGGTLKAGDSAFEFLLQNAATTKVAAGATIDLNGFSTRIAHLAGAGSVANAGASAVLTLAGANFTGVISGNLSVEISASSNFTGVNTYTGATIINSGQYLFTLGHGSVAGAIIDNGNFIDDDSSGTFTTGLISGSGFVEHQELGTIVFDHANTYSGGTTLLGGTALIGSGKGFGTGLVTVADVKLIGTATEIVTNALTLKGNTAIAAASGTTLTLTGGSHMTWDAGSNPLDLTFGDAAHKGTVVIATASIESVNYADPISVKVAYGTLKASGSALSVFLANAHDVTVAAGATLNLGGVGMVIHNIASAGSITNSSVALATLDTENTSSVSGVISGKLAVDVSGGSLELTGIDTYTGGTTIFGGAWLTLAGGGSITGNVNDGGTFTIEDTDPLTLAGVISGAGSLIDAGPGPLTLSGANTYTGGTTLEHGELIVTNGKALGAQGLTLDNHTTLISTATMTLAATGSGNLTFNGASTIAAAHGTTLTIGGSESVKVNAATIDFGQAGDDGVIIFKANTASGVFPLHLNVNAGTLKAGDAAFGDDLTIDAASITVAASAALDLGGFDVEAPGLLGTGAVINSGAAATLADDSGTFAGVISGNIRLAPGDVILTGTNTYTGGTTIGSGDSLQLGAGGTTGAIVGNIDDEGTLAIDRSEALTLAGAISGAGAVDQKGAGTTTLSGLNSYSGGTTISRGELVSERNVALGTGGTITMTGGELLAGVSQTLTHDLTTTGSDTIAAATGTVLTLATATVDLNAGTLYFGDAGHAGTVVLKISSAVNIFDGDHTKVEVRAGLLKAGDNLLSVVLNNVEATRIDTGGTIDAAGHSLEINSLSGVGTVTNSGPAATLTLFNSTSYGGVISGRFSFVELFGEATLTGAETFTGTAVIEGGSVTLSGLFAETVQFNSGGTLVLAAPSRFTGKIEDFQSGSTIDLKNVTAGAGASLAYDAGTGVLTVKDGTHTDTLKFASGLVLGNFAASSDGLGGTDITWQAPPTAARSPMPVPSAAPEAPASPPSPARLVDAMASLSAPYTAAAMLVSPPAPLQPALAAER